MLAEETTLFHQAFLPALDGIVEPESLKKVRQKCVERLGDLGQDESFEYLQLKSLLSQKFHKADASTISKETCEEYLFPECKNSFITFVNGQFRPDLSAYASLPKGAVVLPLGQAMKLFGTFLNNSLSKTSKDESDYFVLLNAACHQEGAFLYLPPKTVIKEPIQIVSIIDEAKEGAWMMPRLHLVAGAFSEANIAYRTVCRKGEKYLYNSAIDISLEDNAKISFTIDDLGLPISQSWLFDALRITMKPNSSFKGSQLTNAEKSRRDWRVAIAGSGADVHLSGLWLLDESKEAHVNVVVDHQEPYSRSLQLFKGVLDDKARSGFQGKIVVQQKATKTESYQINKNLMLSSDAEANSKPNLEIMSSDVKASHGATIGQLDQEQLFYLKTRGFSESQARRCMINGFCHEVVEKLFLPSQLARFSEILATFVKA